MKTITLHSGIYAVDPILDGFDIVERPSSNVSFIAVSMLEHKMYVQFLRGSGYMYSEVDYDTLSFAPKAASLGTFVRAKLVNHFPSNKQEKALIELIPPLIITGPITDFPDKCERGKVFVMSEGATITYIEPEQPES